MTAVPHDNRLANLLTDAALQALFMRSRRQDLIDEVSGMKFIYGVDASVVRCWGNPRTNASNSIHHIGRIFRSDDEQLATATAWGLLTFIFEHLGRARLPLLVIPPIDTEVAAILEALHEADPDKPQKVVRKELEKLSEQLGKDLTPAELGKINLKLQDLLLQEIGEHGALRRILLLFTRLVVMKLEEVKLRLPEILREVVLPDTGVLQQWFEYGAAKSGTGSGSNRLDGWMDRLSRAGTWRLEKLMGHDAEVLARLEVWNRKLIAQKTGWRMLYITPDRRLFCAASQHFPSELAGMSFAKAYLRHPRAYLSEDGVLGSVATAESESATEESVGDWLTLLTQPAHATYGELFDTSSKRIEVPKTIRAFSEQMAQNPIYTGKTGVAVADDLEKKWRRFVQGALVTNPVSDVALLGLWRDQKRPAHELAQIVNEAHERLERDRRKMLRDYLKVTTRLGRKFEAVQSAKPLVRSVAPIYFEGWRAANASIAIMSQWSDDHVDEDRYQEALDLIDRDDRTPYAFYLGNAAFFAARGRWRSAALVAKRARRIGIGFHTGAVFANEARGAHGREAAYFEATCLRHLATERSALSAARERLSEAEEILKREIEVGHYKEFVAERLRAERVAIDLTAYQFEALVEAPEVEHEQAFRAITEPLAALVAANSERLAKLAPNDEIKVGDAVDVRIRLETQMLISTMLVAFMPDATALDACRARSALALIEKRIGDSYLSEAAFAEFDRAVVLAVRLRNRLGMGKDEVTLRREFQDTVELIKTTGDLPSYEQRLLERLSSEAATPWGLN